MEKENESMNDMARRVMQEEVIAFGTPHREEHTEWEKALQFEVMEDYLMTAELRYCAKDPVQHMEEMRGHYEHLKSFIHSLLKDQRERIAEKIEKYRQEEDIDKALGKYAGFSKAIDGGESFKNRTEGFNQGIDTALHIIQEEE